MTLGKKHPSTLTSVSNLGFIFNSNSTKLLQYYNKGQAADTNVCLTWSILLFHAPDIIRH